MSATIAVSERERARQILAEIIRQVGGLTSKTELLRVFWHAHLIFAESQPGYLSLWPVVRTPAGPVIRDVDLLLGELVAEGILQIHETGNGAVGGLRLERTEDAEPAAALSPEAVEAIEQSVAVPDGRVDLAHYSTLRSWKEAADGEELNIYLDTIPEGEFAERAQRLQEMTSVLKSIWE